MAATPDGALIINAAPTGNELVEMWRGNMLVAYPITSLRAGYPASTVRGVTPGGAIICQGSPTGEEVVECWINGNSRVAYRLRTLSGNPSGLVGKFFTPSGVQIIDSPPTGNEIIEAWSGNTPVAFAESAVISGVPPLPPNARGVVLGDSYSDLGFSVGLRNHFSWARYLLAGRVRMAVGGQNMALAGTRLTVSTGTNGTYAENSMLFRVQNQIRYMVPEFLILLGGVNDLAPYGNNSTLINGAWQAVYTAIRTLLPTTMRFFAATLPYTTASLGVGNEAVKAAIDSLNAYIRAAVANDPYAVVMDFNAAYNPNTMSIGDAVSHPSELGGYTLGQVEYASINAVLTPGTVLPTSTVTGPTQLDANFALLGSGGSVAGGASGSVANGKTVTGVAGATVAASKGVASVGATQIIAVSGTPSAASNVTFGSTVTINGIGGGFFELLSELKGIAASGGGPAAGLLQFGDTFVNGEGFLATSSDVNAIVPAHAIPYGVIRSIPLQLVTPTASTTAIHTSLRFGAVPSDGVAEVGLQLAQQVDNDAAYAPPFNIAMDAKTSTNFRTSITPTSPTNGVLATARPGGFSGGGTSAVPMVITYQWDKNGNPSGFPATQTYNPSGFISGDVMGCTITGTNGLGSQPVRVTVTFP